MTNFSNEIVATHVTGGFKYAFASGLGLKDLPECFVHNNREYVPVVVYLDLIKAWNTGLLNYAEYKAPHELHGNVYFRIYNG